jgi:hypothetical protein
MKANATEVMRMNRHRLSGFDAAKARAAKKASAAK